MHTVYRLPSSQLIRVHDPQSMLYNYIVVHECKDKHVYTLFAAKVTVWYKGMGAGD